VEVDIKPVHGDDGEQWTSLHPDRGLAGVGIIGAVLDEPRDAGCVEQASDPEAEARPGSAY
jgi:hypothetical protein